MLKRPNVILIVADNMGYGDFGIFNDGPARTPHLECWLARGSVWPNTTLGRRRARGRGRRC